MKLLTSLCGLNDILAFWVNVEDVKTYIYIMK